MEKHNGPWLVKLDHLTVAAGLTETEARMYAAELVSQASDRAYTLPGRWVTKAAELGVSILTGDDNFGKVGQWFIQVQPMR